MQAVGLAQGQIVGDRYKIIKRIGNGAFGHTYLAEDIHIPDVDGCNRCVVKQLQPQQTDPDSMQTARRLFNAEAVVLSKLGSHPHIPHLAAYFEEDDEFYLVQEYINGHDLSHEIGLGKTLSESDVIQFLWSVLEILDFVHKNNVIHRDLKPSNIMRRTQDHSLVLIDFGVVKQIGSQLVPNGQTSLTVAVGTQGYMSPEMACGKPRFCSDIYSLGKVAIQALTGVVPWSLQDDPETDEVMWRHLAQVSPPLGDIIDKMVRHNYRERYQSVRQVKEAMESLLTNTPTTVMAPAPPSALPSKKTNLIPNTRWLIRIGATVLVLGGIGAWHMFEHVQLQTAIADLEGLLDRGDHEACIDRADSLLPNPMVEAIQDGCYFLQAEKLAGDDMLMAAIAAAQEVAPDRPDYGEKAQTLINTVANQLLTNAKDLVEQNQFKAAITQANQIPTDHATRKEADEVILEAANGILKIAENRYSDNLEQAIALAQEVSTLAKEIPAIATVAEEAKTQITTWQTELKTGEETIATAEKALKDKPENYLETAEDALAQLPDTVYWQNRAKSLQEQIAAARPQPQPVEEIPVSYPAPVAPVSVEPYYPPVVEEPYYPPIPAAPVYEEPPAPVYEPLPTYEPPQQQDLSAPVGGGPLN